jgi:subtilisin family serine protease
MTHRKFLTFAYSLFLISALAAPAAAAPFLLEITPGADISQVTANHGLALVKQVSDFGSTVFLVSTTDPVPSGLIAEVTADPAVVQFEPDVHLAAYEIPPGASPVTNVAAIEGAIQNSSPVNYFGTMVRGGYAQQPSAFLINLPKVLPYLASRNVPGTVAVIDTGVDPSHPALQGVLVQGYDFTSGQPGIPSETAGLNQSTVAILDQSTVAILDKIYTMVLNQSTVAILDQSTVAILDANQIPSHFGHGTMVAGLIHLVAPTAPIMPLKAFNADGSARLSDIVAAIYYAVDHGAKVINMSFSTLTPSPTLTDAVQYAASKNVICVASAGNDGIPEVVYPAAYPGVIGVASTNAVDQRSLFSNYGPGSFSLAAPGEALITTYPGNNYAGVWGTSFSTALTSGAVAELTQFRPSLRVSTAIHALQQGPSVIIDDTDADDARLDVFASFMYLFRD